MQGLGKIGHELIHTENVIVLRAFLFLIVQLSFVGLISSGCQPLYIPLEHSSKHVPFVESISAPAVANLGEEFKISASLSSMLDPSLLSGTASGIIKGGTSFGYFAGKRDGKYHDGKFLAFYIDTLHAGLEPSTGIVEFSCIPETPGPAYFYLPTTRHRKDGGISFAELEVSNSSYPPESDLIQYREIVVNVLPAE